MHLQFLLSNFYIHAHSISVSETDLPMYLSVMCVMSVTNSWVSMLKSMFKYACESNHNTMSSVSECSIRVYLTAILE